MSNPICDEYGHDEVEVGTAESAYPVELVCIRCDRLRLAPAPPAPRPPVSPRPIDSPLVEPWRMPKVSGVDAALCAIETLWPILFDQLTAQVGPAWSAAERDADARPAAPTTCESCAGPLRRRAPHPAALEAALAADPDGPVPASPVYCPRCALTRVRMPVVPMPVRSRPLDLRGEITRQLHQLEAALVEWLNTVHGYPAAIAYREPMPERTVPQRCDRMRLSLLPAVVGDARFTPIVEHTTDVLVNLALVARNVAGDADTRVHLSARCPHCERRTLVVHHDRDLIECENDLCPHLVDGGGRASWHGVPAWRKLGEEVGVDVLAAVLDAAR